MGRFYLFIGLSVATLAISGFGLSLSATAATVILSFAFFAAAVIYRDDVLLHTGQSATGLEIPWRPWITTTLILILVMMTWAAISVPRFTDDFFRYYWDAFVNTHGVNPYLYPPSAIIDDFSSMDSIYRKLNSPDYHSVYPPFMQVIFMLATVFPSPAVSIDLFLNRLESIQMGLTLFAGVMLVLNGLLDPDRQPGIQLTGLLFLTAPLFWFQGIVEAHTDLTAAMLLVVAVVLLRQQAFLLGGLTLAFAIWTKLTPLLLIPLLGIVLIQGDVRAWLKALGGLLAGTVIVWIPFYNLNAIGGIMDSLSLYFNRFEFNSFFYALSLNHADYYQWWGIKPWIGTILMGFFSIAYLGLFRLAWKDNRFDSAVTLSVYAFLFYLLFSSTLHPWYFLIPLALAFMTRHIPYSLLAWIGWTLFSLFIYDRPYDTTMYWGFRILEYASVLVLLLFDIQRDVLPIALRVRTRIKVDWFRHYLGATHLDIGTNRGEVLAEIQTTVEHAVGSDVYIPPRPVTCPLVMHDAFTIPFKPNSFDSVSLVFVAHHSKDIEGLLRRAGAVAKDRLILVESLYANHFQATLLEGLDRLANAFRSGHFDRGRITYLRLPTWISWMHHLGWQLELVREFRGNPVHPVGLMIFRRPHATLTQ